ncbi:aminotransferase class V-fold PLP-dependent enzyme [Chitinophaga vietnamensis]|uniref:aminotransferase class V-fold PLP-dependent enzyme n=1 Tax=Chitinophaga vietnamensis TaxID=2593957 RepID=UPI0011779A93|nr:aminotransferase class V-fold PLP-dependent enzyme [Chitinophaga vietnamensis]
MINWEKIREDYPASENYIYLGTNGGGPVSRSYVAHATALLEEQSRKGRLVMPSWDSQTSEARALLARMINASPSEIAFITNTAQGITNLHGMFPKHYEIITMHDEFPTSFVNWMHNGYKVHLVGHSGNGVISIEDIEKQITPATRLLITSHVMFRTGFKQDLKKIGELCKKHDLIHIVDATQSFGVEPVDVQACHVDIYFFHAYKWVTGGYGIGGMYISQKILDQYPPQVMGWYNVEYSQPDFHSVQDHTVFHPKKNAQVFEGGTLPYFNILMLKHTLEYLNNIGLDHINAYVHTLIRYLHEQAAKHNIRILSNFPAQHLSAIQRLDITPEQFANIEKRNIVARYKNKQLTIGLNFYNNRKDVDTLLGCLTQDYTD